jgi:para-aminobenzoate synthetase/4-amino-4-deoxychorismate lyase
VEKAEEAIASGLWIAGYVSYEAGSGWDEALKTHAPGELPVAVLAAFQNPEIASPPPFPGKTLRIRGSLGIAREEFNESIAQIREAIRQGDTYQVNYTYPIRSTWKEDPYDLFRQLLYAQAATYGAYLDLGRFAICSASPELFFRRDGDLVRSRPMKGTLRRASTPEGGAPLRLTGSEKDRAENLMIVDMVRNDMSKICEPGSVTVPDRFMLEAYPTVWQLTSRVHGRSKAGLSEVFGALFPPASITGAPKAAAMGYIRTLETGPRGVYTGTIGFAAPDGRAQFNVAIRTAVVDKQKSEMVYHVGGGIVSDSTAESEYDESIAKAAILYRDRPEFDLLETIRWDPGSGYFLLDRHLARMALAAGFFGYKIDVTRLRKNLQRAAGQFSDNARRVRVTSNAAGETLIESIVLRPAPFSTAPRVAIAPARVPSADPFLQYKTTHRAIYSDMLAACPEADDVLLVNERGEVTESCYGNVFVERDGETTTPPVTSGLIPGTLRAELLEAGEVQERVLLIDDLATVEAITIGNSVRGRYPIGNLLLRDA